MVNMGEHFIPRWDLCNFTKLRSVAWCLLLCVVKWMMKWVKPRLQPFLVNALHQGWPFHLIKTQFFVWCFTTCFFRFQIASASCQFNDFPLLQATSEANVFFLSSFSLWFPHKLPCHRCQVFFFVSNWTTFFFPGENQQQHPTTLNILLKHHFHPRSSSRSSRLHLIWLVPTGPPSGWFFTSFSIFSGRNFRGKTRILSGIGRWLGWGTRVVKKGSSRLNRVLYGIPWGRVRNMLFASVLFDTI